ncbi:MAG: DUF177 domain-containing protein [Proteobacteria bacterium]|nr:DUF177 domain-containing protein [Pseudomonadota bacterium]
MKLLFEEITGKTQFYSIAESYWFPAIEECSIEAATANVWVSRQDHDTVLVKGKIDGRFQIVCDRCGELFAMNLQSEFVYLATTRREEISELTDLECNEEDSLILYLAEPIVEVDQILREQALLAIPLKNLCSEDCRGICAGCGHVLNKEPCCCKVDISNSPFAALKKLKNQ